MDKKYLYKRAEQFNGSKKIDNSIYAIYDLPRGGTNLTITGYTTNEQFPKDEIEKTILDDTIEIAGPVRSYQFEKSGRHTAKIIFKNNPTSLGYFFYQCYNLINVDFTFMETKDLTSVRNFVRDCMNLTKVNLSKFSTPKLQNMFAAFHNCQKLIKIDLSSWDLRNVNLYWQAFGWCNSLEEIIMKSDVNPSANYGTLFEKTTSNGTLYYPKKYAHNYTNLLAQLPPTWKAVATE